MTVYNHELRQGRKGFIVWTLSVALFAAMCIFLYPSMEEQMEDVSELFASMGAFTAAFGMDRLSIGSLTGYYAVECGTIVALGGAFYASVAAISMLSKEEKDRTAEFLFTHPVKRGKVLTEKLLALLTEIFLLNVIVFAFCAASMGCIGEEIPWKELCLLQLAYFICQVETGLICFGISAFSRKNSLGIGLGLALVFYFMNLLANISEKAESFKYLTPFGYTEGADIVTDMSLNTELIAIGLCVGAGVSIAGFVHYLRKDLKC